jgi:hypothetical protein
MLATFQIVIFLGEFSCFPVNCICLGGREDNKRVRIYPHAQHHLLNTIYHPRRVKAQYKQQSPILPNHLNYLTVK